MRVRWLVISLTFALLFLWGAAVVWAMPAQPHRLDPAHLTDLRTPTPVPIEPLLIVGGMPGLGIYPDYCCGEASFQYMFNNAWRGIRHGRLMEVVAGRVKGTDQRNTIVGIQIWEDGSWHHDGYQVWPTPQKVGCVEVVSVVGSLATLQACNPQLPPIQFVFDVDRHVWVGKPPPLYPPSAASAAAGGRLSGQMAYVEDDELWLLDLATNKRAQLTDTREGSMPAVGNGFPQWIADGQHLVNWRTWLHGKDATIDFMKLDLATGWDIQLGDLGTLGLNPYTQRSLQTHYAMPSLDPHPPGFYLEWRETGGGSAGTDNVIWRRADHRETVLYEAPVGCTLSGGTVSPDARFILVWGNDQCPSILLQKTRGTYRPLATDVPPTGCVFGAWGAQRHILAYTSACETLLGKHTEEDTALGTEIHVLDLDQAQPRSTILYTGDAVTGLAWSGNDAWLAFSTRDTAHKPNGLWVMNAAGGSLQQIAARGAGPAWRPEVAASLPGAGRPGPPSVADLLILSLTLSIGGYLLRRTSKIRRHQK